MRTLEATERVGFHKLLHSRHAILLNVVLSDMPQNPRSKRVRCTTYRRVNPVSSYCTLHFYNKHWWTYFILNIFVQVFSFNEPTKCIIVASLQHITAWQYHLQGVQTKLWTIYGKMCYIYEVQNIWWILQFNTSFCMDKICEFFTVVKTYMYKSYCKTFKYEIFKIYKI
jgi:hypothetical protein